ncbi:MAG: succinate dehydrogenase cytochrome b subunit [Planctomycetes bacterium]|nr:succinate dehydrogenase cytochrome b subunit [Planctomycetota bacterium]
MAVTGVMLILFVLGHMVGNLQVFAGAEKLNKYAHFLQSLGGVLWLIRGGLLLIFVLHIWAALKVSAISRAARPVPYAYKKGDLVTTYAAKTMMVSGVIVALFVVYHVLHFTTGSIDIAGSYGQMTTLADGTEVPDVYAMVIGGFKNIPTALTYIAANLLLAVHLSHGAASLLQTLGFRHKNNAATVKKFGIAVGLIVGIGNIAMPLSIMLGLVG